MTRKILVTSALPYANGAIHLGHLVEYIQTDIWVRFQKMCGQECWYVCADDTHGTPIMLRAEKEGITPEALIERVHGEHTRDFAGFHVGFDNYDTTHSEETRACANEIYARLQAAGLIETRTIEQYYDPLKQMFLPDRFIKGECPKCGAHDQYGDNCESCGSAYTANELKNPYSAVSGARPELRQSEHFFFRLSDPRCQAFLRRWTQGEGRLQNEAANKLQEWLGSEGENRLTDWDISRDSPYFGFEIPDAPGKYFYVWLDAPIGYMGSFRNLCTREGLDFDEYWRPDSTAELYHFIGKDILYFHALFWPAELENAGYRTPSKVFAHGFLTVDGAKMSKSRGTFITAESYLVQGLDPEWLRYYYAAKLSGSMEDIDLNLDDFIARVNSDLVGKFVNIASRSAGFIVKHFAGQLCTCDESLPAIQAIRERRTAIADHYEAREFGKAIREIMALTDLANQYIDSVKPWELARHAGRESDLQVACSNALNLFRLFAILLKPVLPALGAKAEAFLNVAPLVWEDSNTVLAAGHAINAYRHLLTRVDKRQVDALLLANRESLASPPQAAPQKHAERQEKAATVAVAQAAVGASTGPHISIDDFMSVDLRIARISEATPVEGSDKLVRLLLDVGTLGTRQVFAGIQATYDPATLVGRLTMMVANLAPRKMKFGLSEGMLLAASDPDGQTPGIFLLSPDAGAKPGMRVK
ncbi:MAG: methionine--tRNA ligase [Candidatus Accumulibacter phosphatis]|jgi:methionyl-tRNA synthetase|uniref:Methionine--tRNA ligase n=2 Tax=Candidatus Accumulibacter TaxID=327159 RepID=A0A084Y6Z2_9PROT|nr:MULTISPECIES: methionine--tRNA ligase [Candidatus Accumulibacter]KFB70486.1 MAG: Methionine--tRNA ligase [Candidatus Accumulibacter phosphatis]NMQ07510.1 methionine--tRNA ligase [Candidatus Accumulibacter contiguus]HRF11570.1 methionine--tRNA ligase [Candidatus Accumulibacter phosphatis]